MFNANQRTKQLREKIAELSKIDPNSYISKEELQEKKKRLYKNETNMSINTFRSENQKANKIISQPKDIQKPNIAKKIFAFDTNYYKTLHSNYANIATSNIKEISIQPSKLNKKQIIPQDQEMNDSPMKNLQQVQKPNFIQLVPVNNQTNPPQQQKQNIQKQIQKDSLKINSLQNKVTIDTKTPLSSLKPVFPIEQKKQDKPKLQIFNLFSKNTQNKPSATQTNPIFGKTIFSNNNNNNLSTKQFFSKPIQPQPAHIVFTQQTPQGKPSFFNTSFSKQDNNKPQVPKLTQNLIGQEKRSYSQPLAQTKKGQIKSIFDRSNQGSLNLNAAKPVPIFQVNNLFQKGKEQPSQNLPQSKPPSFLQNSQKFGQKPFNLFPSPINPSKPIELQIKIEEKSKLLETTKSNNVFSNNFGSSNSLFPSFNQNTPANNLFNTNNLTFDKKPQMIPTFSQPIVESKHEEKVIQNPIIESDKKTINIVQTRPSPFNLFHNNKDINTKPASNQLFASSSQPALFGSTKALNISNNLFQNNTLIQQTKKQEVPQVIETPQPIVNKQSPKKSDIVQKQFEKEQKKNKAIGPNGQVLQLPTLFQNQKPKNAFQSFSQKPNLFTSVGNPSTNIFNQTPSIQPLTSLFGQNAGTSLFSNTASQLFNSSSNPTKTLFNNTESSLFSKQNNNNNNVQLVDQDNEEDDDDGPIEAEDDANPDLCEMKYEYIQTNTFFKEPANKFRQGAKQTLENITVSIQKFQNSQNRYLYVKMPNKCVAFCGKFLKKITEVRILNNSKKNIEIKKILLSGQNVTSVELALVKIQFKDETVGDKFLKEVEKAIKEETQ